jgi:hypothetical protein
MSEVIQVAFGAEYLRAAACDGKKWFVVSDIGRILEMQNIRCHIVKLREEDKCVLEVNTRGGKQAVAVVSEEGLYDLIFLSRTPAAKKFQFWITHTILPSIRETGYYLAPSGPFALLGAEGLYLEGPAPEPNRITEPLPEPEQEAFAQERAKVTGHPVEVLRPLARRVA